MVDRNSDVNKNIGKGCVVAFADSLDVESTVMRLKLSLISILLT